MRRMKRKHICRVMTTIMQQIAATTPLEVYYCWGVERTYATTIKVIVNERRIIMAGLAMHVNGFQYQGKLVIALDEAYDFYRIYFVKAGRMELQRSNVGFEELGATLDSLIEVGTMSRSEYRRKVMKQHNIVAF